MLTRKQLAEQARSAADLIETQGWFKQVDKGSRVDTLTFPVGDSKKCFCALTALPMFGCLTAIDYFAVYLGYRGSDTAWFVTHWNDSQDSPEVVISTLRKFADDVEKELVEVA